MYCPKCKQTFEKGSRRFCPTDGARLISDEKAATQSQAGIFANLIPKMDGISDLGDALSELPGVVVSDLDSDRSKREDRPAENTDEVFFELDEHDEVPPIAEPSKPETDLLDIPIPERSPAVQPAASGQQGKKVDPSKIPAGHVVLTSGDRISSTPDFDQQDPERFVGRVVKGRYWVAEFLGGDESGLAYLAEDRLAADKKVVVRVLTPGESDEIMDSILAEERVSLSHFSHPSIARLIDSGEFSDGCHFLVSEYIDALSVADILSIHGRFSPQRASRVIRQISNALNEAHQEGILHRDIRPENLIIDPGAGDVVEQAKLVNFGASRGEPSERNLAFQSPEVLDGRINTIVSDIFSLAVVSFQMLTGKLPFSGSTPKEILRSQYAGLAASPTDLRPDLPPAINDVFEKALSFKPAGRYKKAREFADAFCSAFGTGSSSNAPKEEQSRIVNLQPLVPAITAAPPKGPGPAVKPAAPEPKTAGAPPIQEPSRKDRFPELVTEPASKRKYYIGAGVMALLVAVAFGWYYIANNPSILQSVVGPVDPATNANIAVPENGDMPPHPRSLAQPPDTVYYQNTKSNLRGDLVLNFVGFTLYYPKDWKVNGPQQGNASSDTRGKFLDISSSTPDDRLKEQMLISYYPSMGTFAADAEKFPQLVKETNETLEKILPDYKMVSQGEIMVNGSWRAYEVKFQGGGTAASGEKLMVWGRRLFVPASRPGVRNGFEITMLATSLAENVRGVDDVGERGELGQILYSFEPSQNF